MSKKEIRTEGLAARRAIPYPRVKEMSKMVQQNLSGLSQYRSARRIASYVAREDEVHTVPILERALAEGKSVLVPKVDGATDSLLFFEIKSAKELSDGYFGILEPAKGEAPVPLSTTELVLVPLVAWDTRGYRVGYGGGYFDKALSERGKSAAVGLAFESQAVPRIPESPSDVRLDMLVTEARVLKFSPMQVNR